MNERGRPVLGATAGLFLGIFLGLILFQLKVFESSSPLLLVLPLIGLFLGIGLSLWAPFGRAAVAASYEASPPRPDVIDEPDGPTEAR